MNTLFIIGFGSFFGGISRFLLSRYIQNKLLSSFPFGTLVVNFAGCFIIGLLYGLSERSTIMSAEWRMFLIVGYCGGFTTFSTFAYENMALLKNGSFYLFVLYMSSSVVSCILSAYLGYSLTKSI